MEKYKARWRGLLDMTREEFESATHMESRYDGGCYHYYPGGVDDDEARISYLIYLTEEKGYSL